MLGQLLPWLLSKLLWGLWWGWSGWGNNWGNSWGLPNGPEATIQQVHDVAAKLKWEVLCRDSRLDKEAEEVAAC